MLTRIYHKKNELFEVNFYKDKECTDLIDLMRENLPYPENAKISDISNFYIDIEKGDITPITFLLRFSIKDNDYFYTPYLQFHLDKVRTFYDITPNLSKYIPENNSVLFLNEDDLESYEDWFPNKHIGFYINDGKNEEEFRANNIESLISGIADVKKGNITIFLTNGTETELQKANELARDLKKEYDVEEVNVFVLHCWDYYEYRGKIIAYDSYGDSIEWELHKTSPFSGMYPEVISKLITTNSTGILEIQNKDNLQVIDCYDIFNDYLQNKNE